MHRLARLILVVLVALLTAGGVGAGTRTGETVLTYPYPDVRLKNGTEVTWLHRDHLSSVRTMTNAAGARAAGQVYVPFGEQVQIGAPLDPEETKGFIGERYDSDAGLQYLNARYYDPRLAMFIQPDWFEVTKAGVGTNRYAYSGNDPVNGSDPGGNCYEYGDTGGTGSGECPVLGTYPFGPGVWAHDKVNEYADGLDAKYGPSLMPEGDALNLNLTEKERTVWPGDKYRAAADLFIPTTNNDIAIGVMTLPLAAAGKTGPALKSSFFADTRYTQKVLEQMSRRVGEFHSFPEAVKAFEGVGTVKTITGGDGVAREMLEIPGSYAGREGVFQFMKEADGSINHRLFVPDNNPPTPDKKPPTPDDEP